MKDVPTDSLEAMLGCGGADERAVLAATRELLWIGSGADAKAAAISLVEELGGQVVAADDADDEALPVDVSFGEGTPMLPTAPSMSVAHMLLSRHLPGFMRDAHRAVELAARTQRLAEDAEVDALTGLANRRVVDRALPRLEPGAVVILIDLDRFKRLNDSLGHAEGDRVLRAFGRVLADTVRARDVAGRYGGEEFVVALPGVSERADVEGMLLRLRGDWERRRPHPLTFSAGIAFVADEPSQALRAADGAMYAAKRDGRDRWQWADDDTVDRNENVAR